MALCVIAGGINLHGTDARSPTPRSLARQQLSSPMHTTSVSGVSRGSLPVQQYVLQDARRSVGSPTQHYARAAHPQQQQEARASPNGTTARSDAPRRIAAHRVPGVGGQPAVSQQQAAPGIHAGSSAGGEPAAGSVRAGPAAPAATSTSADAGGSAASVPARPLRALPPFPHTLMNGPSSRNTPPQASLPSIEPRAAGPGPAAPRGAASSKPMQHAPTTAPAPRKAAEASDAPTMQPGNLQQAVPLPATTPGSADASAASSEGISVGVMSVMEDDGPAGRHLLPSAAAPQEPHHHAAAACIEPEPEREPSFASMAPASMAPASSCGSQGGAEPVGAIEQVSAQDLPTAAFAAPQGPAAMAAAEQALMLVANGSCADGVLGAVQQPERSGMRRRSRSYLVVCVDGSAAVSAGCSTASSSPEASLADMPQPASCRAHTQTGDSACSARMRCESHTSGCMLHDTRAAGCMQPHTRGRWADMHTHAISRHPQCLARVPS